MNWFERLRPKQLQVLAMAYQRKEAISKIRDQVHTLVESMVYIYLFPNAVEVPHWEGEVKGSLGIIKRYTNLKGGKLSKEDVLNLIWEEPLGKPVQRVQEWRQAVSDKQVGAYPRHQNLDNLGMTFQYLASMLVSPGEITYERIKTALTLAN